MTAMGHLAPGRSVAKTLRHALLSAAVGIPLCAYLASRLALLLVGWFALAFIGHSEVTPTLHQLFGLTCRWDCGWYLSIAQHGYSIVSPVAQPDATNLAFWPAFPFAARWFSDVTRISILGSGVLLSNLSFILCLIFFRKYSLQLGVKTETATFGTFLLAFAPQSYVFSGFYSEPFCLLGILGSMYFARTERWWVSGAFAILATLSRPTGILLFLFLVVFAYQQIGWRGFVSPWKDARPFIPIVLLPAGHLAVLTLAYRVSGDAFAQEHTRVAGWYGGFEAPWQAIVTHLVHPPSDTFLTTAALVLALSIIPLLRKKTIPEAAYAIGAFGLLLSNTTDAGIIRYVITIPPVFLGIAYATRNKLVARYAIIGICAMLGAAMFCAWTVGAYIAT